MQELQDTTVGAGAAAAAPDDGPGRPAANVHITPGMVSRVTAKIEKYTLPRPAQYKDEFEWYAAWSRENGVSLPPDVPELRKLRNFIDNKVKRFRAGELTVQAQEMFALHGIDLSEYSANNTGTGEREPDEPRIAQLRALHDATGSYDLSGSTDSGLLTWQSKLLNSFYASGRTARMKRIEAQLPGLRIALWRKPGDPLPKIESHWMEVAGQVQACSHEYPIFRGEFHPKMPQHLLQWCRTQQQLANAARGTLSAAQKGVLKDLEVLDKPVRKQNAQRLQLDQALGVQARLPDSDRHLNTFLGAGALVRFILMGRPITAYYVWFGLSPSEHERMQATIRKDKELLLQLPTHVAKRELATVKRLEGEQPGYFAAKNARTLQDPAQRPAILSDAGLELGLLVERIRRKCDEAQIQQNLAV